MGLSFFVRFTDAFRYLQTNNEDGAMYFEKGCEYFGKTRVLVELASDKYSEFCESNTDLILDLFTAQAAAVRLFSFMPLSLCLFDYGVRLHWSLDVDVLAGIVQAVEMQQMDEACQYSEEVVSILRVQRVPGKVSGIIVLSSRCCVS